MTPAIVSEEILVRLLERADDSQQEISSDVVVFLPFRDAAKRIAADQAEPVIEIQTHLPPLPPAGVTLAEAIEIYAGQHPDALALGGVKPKPSRIAVRAYSNPPSWQAMVARSKLREFAGLKPPPQRSLDSWLGDRAQDWWGHAPRIIEVEKLERELKRLISRFVLAAVLRRFFMCCHEGSLVAAGVSEDNLATLNQRTIPSGWWTRDVAVHTRTNEIWERTGDNRKQEYRRWSNVRIGSGPVVGTTETSNQDHAGKAKLRGQVQPWLEDSARRNKSKYIKEDYLKQAQAIFGKGVTKNFFNEVWRASDLPEECRAPGRRTENL